MIWLFKLIIPDFSLVYLPSMLPKLKSGFQFCYDELPEALETLDFLLFTMASCAFWFILKISDILSLDTTVFEDLFYMVFADPIE